MKKVSNSIVELHKCNQCGTEFEGNYCPECGSKYEAATAAPPPLQQQAYQQYAPATEIKPKKKKKPFFLRWWFILLAIIVIAFVALSSGRGGKYHYIAKQNDKVYESEQEDRNSNTIQSSDNDSEKDKTATTDVKLGSYLMSVPEYYGISEEIEIGNYYITDSDISLDAMLYFGVSDYLTSIENLYTYAEKLGDTVLNNIIENTVFEGYMVGYERFMSDYAVNGILYHFQINIDDYADWYFYVLSSEIDNSTYGILFTATEDCIDICKDDLLTMFSSIRLSSSTDSKNDYDTGTSNGIRSDFKEAMDAYEAFYDEYCDFMKKYSENPTDLSLLSEYADMLTKAGEMDEAFDKWESEDLSDEELKYYLEVNTRVMQKLVDVMY